MPVAWPDEATHGVYTYYVAPVASQLVPPGGPVLGMTSVTVLGTGFAGLGTDVASLGCAFTGAPGIALSVSPDGSRMVPALRRSHEPSRHRRFAASLWLLLA